MSESNAIIRVFISPEEVKYLDLMGIAKAPLCVTINIMLSSGFQAVCAECTNYGILMSESDYSLLAIIMQKCDSLMRHAGYTVAISARYIGHKNELYILAGKKHDIALVR